MKVKILQRGGDKANHDVLEDAARVIMGQLVSARMANTLNIRIAMRASKMAYHTMGQVSIKTNGSKAQKVFEITIQRDVSLQQQLHTLAHELCHVAQVVSKRLQYRLWRSDRKVHVRWEGEHLGLVSSIPYREQPWEIEADEFASAITKRLRIVTGAI